MAAGRRQANLDEDGGISPFKRDDESFHSDMSGRGAEVEFVVKDVEATDYDLPFPKMVYAHEKDFEDNGLIKEVNETDASKDDNIFVAYSDFGSEELRQVN